MKLKQKSCLISLLSLCILTYQANAKPLLQCVVDTKGIGHYDNGIKAYVVEEEKRGVYGKWYTIHDYDSTPPILSKRELLNENGKFIGNVSSIVLLKDVGNRDILTPERINLRDLYSINGSIFNHMNNAAESPLPMSLPKFELKYKFAADETVYFGNRTLIFSPWTFNGLDEKGAMQKDLPLYCNKLNLKERSSLDSYFKDIFISISEIPTELIGFENGVSNFATFRLSQENLSSKNEISSLRRVQWRITGKNDNIYTIDYRLSSENKNWYQTTAKIITIDPTSSENAHPLEARVQQYYEFSFADITKKSASNVEYYISIVANIKNYKDKISYIKKVDSKEAKPDYKVIDDNYVIKHKVPLVLQQPIQPPAVLPKVEEVDSKTDN